MAEHIFAGSCPDETQPDARDANCPACELIVETERLEDQIAALTVERDELREQSHSFITGSIPPSPITKDTEIVFVAGRAFVNAIKHEEAVGRIAEERDRLRDSLARRESAAMILRAEITARQSETMATWLERDEAIQERDLAYARDAAVKNTLANVGAPETDSDGRTLTANGMLVDWLAGRRNPQWIGGEGEVIDELRGLMDTLLAAVGRVTGLRGTTEPWASRLSALHDVANEIAKRTGYAGGQDDG